jgi:hypothetical protein
MERRKKKTRRGTVSEIGTYRPFGAAKGYGSFEPNAHIERTRLGPGRAQCQHFLDQCQ